MLVDDDAAILQQPDKRMEVFEEKERRRKTMFEPVPAEALNRNIVINDDGTFEMEQPHDRFDITPKTISPQ